jgi:DivIVA domain-containing protein
MAISFTRPDPSSPTAVSTANFSQSRRGYEPEEVREFLRMVAAELARLQEREKFLERELRMAQRNAPNASVVLDEEVVTRMLGEEAARILSTAREAATQIKMRAEDGAARVLREATDEAQRVREEAEIESARRRQDAASDAESELQMAKQQGRDMVNEARAYRERVLGELARRREMARQQIEQLVHGRDRLLNAFERARIAAVDVMAEMTPLGEPNEYVNLSPTTGPVPLMVARDAEAPSEQAPVAEPEPDDVAVALVEADLVEDELVEDELVEAEPVLDELADVEPADDDLRAIEAEADDDAHHDTDDDIDVVAVDVADAVDAAEDLVDDAEPPVVEHVDAADELAAEVVDDGELATVVALFGGGDDEQEPSVGQHEESDADAPMASVDDLFARLRAARAQTVVARATAEPAADVEAEASAEPVAEPVTDVVLGDDLSVFQASPVAPAAAAAETDDTPFGRRDAELTPLIVAGARKLKRVLADEQNDVLHVLRRTQPVTALDALLPSESEHLLRYAAAVEGELRLAALAGAASVDDGDKGDHLHEINRARALQPAIDGLAATVVVPLRERLERLVIDADGDNGELADGAARVSRVEDAAHRRAPRRRRSHRVRSWRPGRGRTRHPGVLGGRPATGPACPDAEDNALGGVVGAGAPFPTDHTCAPAHEGCRCMLRALMCTPARLGLRRVRNPADLPSSRKSTSRAIGAGSLLIIVAVIVVGLLLSARFLSTLLHRLPVAHSVGRGDVFWGSSCSPSSPCSPVRRRVHRGRAAQPAHRRPARPLTFSANMHPVVERFHELFGRRLRLVRIGSPVFFGLLFALPATGQWQVAAVPQQQVVRHRGSRSSATTSASTCSGCRSSRSCSTGCSPRCLHHVAGGPHPRAERRHRGAAAPRPKVRRGHQGAHRRAARTARRREGRRLLGHPLRAHHRTAGSCRAPPTRWSTPSCRPWCCSR